MIRRFLALPIASKLWISVAALISGTAFAVGYNDVLLRLYGTPSANSHLTSYLTLKAVPKRIDVAPGEKVASALEGGEYRIDIKTPPYVVENESEEIRVSFNLLSDDFQAGTYKAFLTSSGQFSILSLQPCQDQPLQQSIACMVVRKPISRIEFKWTVDGGEVGSGRLTFTFAKPKINYFGGVVPTHWSDTDIDHKLSSTMTFRFNDISKTVNPAEQPKIAVGSASVNIAGSAISLPLEIKTTLGLTQIVRDIGAMIMGGLGFLFGGTVGTVLVKRFQPKPKRKARKKHTKAVKAAGEEATSSVEKQSKLDAKKIGSEALNSQGTASKSDTPVRLDKKSSAFAKVETKTDKI